MVDVTTKPEVYREATAKGVITLKTETVKLIEEGIVEKGDPIHTAKIAGILAAKHTSTLLPLCHPLPLTNVDLQVEIVDSSTVEVETTVKTTAKTGVEMEALVATGVALLTIWDMTKQYEKDENGQYPSTLVENLRVIRKVKRE